MADRDVIVVGGGPAGTAVAVFTARYGLDTAVFDRGNSSLRQCAYLENYPGFPGGIDISTAYDLFHDHVAEAGAEVVSALVESITVTDDGFAVETGDGEVHTASRVIAATTYDESYLTDIDERFVGDGSEDSDDHFDRDHPGKHGRTAVDGFYVAGPLAGVESQVAVSIGHGSHVGIGVVTDYRREAEGAWDELAAHTDWVVKQGRYEGEEWRETIEAYYAESAPDDLDDDRIEKLTRRKSRRQQNWQITDEEVDRRREAGHRLLARHLDDDAILDAVDDDAIRAYAADLDSS